MRFLVTLKSTDSDDRYVATVEAGSTREAWEKALDGAEGWEAVTLQAGDSESAELLYGTQ